MYCIHDGAYINFDIWNPHFLQILQNELLTSSNAGLMSSAGPHRNCLSTSHVSRSFVNLYQK